MIETRERIVVKNPIPSKQVRPATAMSIESSTKICSRCAEKMHPSIEAQNNTWETIQKVTQCQVSQYNGENGRDIWILLGEKVINASLFAQEYPHPGGIRVLQKRAGQDCSNDFYFHSQKSRNLWLKYQVALLVPCALLKTASDTENICMIC